MLESIVITPKTFSLGLMDNPNLQDVVMEKESRPFDGKKEQREALLESPPPSSTYCYHRYHHHQPLLHPKSALALCLFSYLVIGLDHDSFPLLLAAFLSLPFIPFSRAASGLS
jgi:hypothetical protein